MRDACSTAAVWVAMAPSIRVVVSGRAQSVYAASQPAAASFSPVILSPPQLSRTSKLVVLFIQTGVLSEQVYHQASDTDTTPRCLQRLLHRLRSFVPPEAEACRNGHAKDGALRDEVKELSPLFKHKLPVFRWRLLHPLNPKIPLDFQYTASQRLVARAPNGDAAADRQRGWSVAVARPFGHGQHADRQRA